MSSTVTQGRMLLTRAVWVATALTLGMTILLLAEPKAAEVAGFWNCRVAPALRVRAPKVRLLVSVPPVPTDEMMVEAPLLSLIGPKVSLEVTVAVLLPRKEMVPPLSVIGAVLLTR